ncbi:MAG: leucine-rich repeat domain-containing protein, partial [Clostridia bacterium]|nr:leucine-rich repeat domain-containing protein [Clostridia bacterium]
MEKSKRILATVLAIIAVLSLSVVCVVAATDEEVEGYYTYKNLAGSVTITDVDSAISGNLVIPSTLGGGTVTSIGSNAFNGCTSLKSVVIPDSVETIEYGAFEGCTGMTSLTIGEGVTSINSYAFRNCKGLTEINFNAVNMSDLGYSYGLFGYAGSEGEGITVTIGE